MDLTKDDIEVGQVGQWEDPNTWQCTIQYLESKEEAEKVKQQLLDDYEKARKWDTLENAKTHEALVDYPKLLKLRELIEKRQKDARDSGELSDYDCGMIYDVIQKLLEESKK